MARDAGTPVDFLASERMLLQRGMISYRGVADDDPVGPASDAQVDFSEFETGAVGT